MDSKHINRVLGWKPDLPDQRDWKFSAVPKKQLDLPEAVDLIAQCPPVYEQGDLGSCTANAAAAACQFAEAKQTNDFDSLMPSRLFVYYNTRVLEGTVRYDSGATLRNSVKSLVNWGYCGENTWNYDIDRFAVKPPEPCYEEAAPRKISSYLRVAQRLTDMQACLAQGFPFMFGFSVYSNMMTKAVDESGNIPMPGRKASVLGGHAMVVVGYDNTKQVFHIRNSWGEDWGDKGYGTIPYKYLTNSRLAADFWTIRFVPTLSNSVVL